MKNGKKVKRVVHTTLFILTIVVISTGLGIAYYQIIEYVTLGFLSKDLSFRIHTIIFVPFLIILVLHSFMPLILRTRSE